MNPPIRLHLSLNTTDLERSVDFYRRLLGAEPARLRPDHAKFELDEPPLVLALNLVAEGGGTLSHLGLRVPDGASLGRARAELARVGLRTREEGTTHCCYALQDKTWVVDPDGVAWEVYQLLREDEEVGEASGSACDPGSAGGTGACCAPAAREATARA